MRKKILLFILLNFFIVNFVSSQARGTKIGYIDMEYILENVRNYKEAKTQLEAKAQKWKQDIESKKNDLNKSKEDFNAEKPLLTRDLIDEREAELKSKENEILEYQQKRFGPSGDLITLKIGLTKPIQDQVFTIVQDIAESKKYDFIFDKTSDLTMLFAAKRYDISDQVLRVINRAEKKEQLTKKQLEAQRIKDEKEDELHDNPGIAERQKILDERKEAREKLIEERKQQQEQKKKEIEEKRKQDLETKKTGTISVNSKTDETTKKTSNTELSTTNFAEKNIEKTTTNKKSAEQLKEEYEARKKEAEEKRNEKIEERNKIIEQRKKELEERRKKIIEEKENQKAKEQ